MNRDEAQARLENRRWASSPLSLHLYPQILSSCLWVVNGGEKKEMRMYNRLWPFLYRLCQAINEMKENSCLILPYVPANSDYKIHAVGWSIISCKRLER